MSSWSNKKSFFISKHNIKHEDEDEDDDDDDDDDDYDDDDGDSTIREFFVSCATIRVVENLLTY